MIYMTRVAQVQSFESRRHRQPYRIWVARANSSKLSHLCHAHGCSQFHRMSSVHITQHILENEVNTSFSYRGALRGVWIYARLHIMRQNVLRNISFICDIVRIVSGCNVSVASFLTFNTILLRNGSRTEPFPRSKLVTSLFPLLHAFTNAVQLCTHDIE
jgi:hypothetical protein